MEQALVLVWAKGRGKGLRPLFKNFSEPLPRFRPSARLIDWTRSNCWVSSAQELTVLTRDRAGTTEPDLDRRDLPENVVARFAANLVRRRLSGERFIYNSLISESARIGKALIEDSVIGPGVVIEDGAVIERSVILDGAVVRKWAELDSTLVGPNLEINSAGLDFPAIAAVHPIRKNRLPAARPEPAGRNLMPSAVAQAAAGSRF